jgi:hypothetical protein
MSKNRTAFLIATGSTASVLLLLSGILLLRKNVFGWGLGCIVLAVAAFLVVLYMSEKHPLTEKDGLELRPFFIPASLFISALVILAFVINSMSGWPRTGAQNRWIMVGWLASMLCLVAGMLWSIRGRLKWQWGRDWFRSHRLKIWILTFILFMSLFFRMYLLTDHPFPWSGDEASVGVEGRRILAGEVTDFFDAGWSGQPNWSFVPTMFSEIIFGQSILAVRLVSAMEGFLAVLALFLLARELFGFRIAALAAGFLAVFPFHLQFSRIGVNNIIDSLTVCVVLWLVFRAIRTGYASSYLWAGLATGLAFYTYVGSRLVMALALLVLLYTSVRQRGYLRTHLAQLGIFLFGLVVAIAPITFYFIQHPDIFMTRIGQESIFLNRWIFHQAENTGQSIAEIILKQFADTTLVYIAKPAIGNFFNYTGPYLSILGSLFFLLGMGYTFTRFFQPRMFILQAWFWSVVILGGVLTLSPPANTRLIMTAPAVALFLALGVNLVAILLDRLKIFAPRTSILVCACLVAILGMQNVATYFGPYRYQDYFEDATGELTQKIGLELQQLGPNYDYYLFGMPRIFAFFPTIDFLAPDNKTYDLTGEDIDSLVLNRGRSNIFVAIPENQAYLERIANKFPGGTMELVNRRYKTEVLYYAYILP